ncbi:hypothetical protein LWI29_021358 [Acer saccharum]|uniref:Uncharacterized protein n=1 Tax=Acer saccharum TaxID=4024 RepID=A0AA39VNP3_ACESA|nr:hypothetical protein LWI29_021358 [Acer saccharum]
MLQMKDVNGLMGDEVFDEGGYVVLGERSGHDEDEKYGDMDNGHAIDMVYVSGCVKKMKMEVGILSI